jgi:hypothetical protein
VQLSLHLDETEAGDELLLQSSVMNVHDHLPKPERVGELPSERVIS